MSIFTSPVLKTIPSALNSSSFPTTAQITADNNFYKTKDNYNVFEFYAMDISQTYGVAPSFIPIIKGSQFTDVSAISIIHASAINFSRLFKFKSDDIITSADWVETNVSFNNMYFGCEDTNAFNNVLYSNASVTVGLANKANIFVNNTIIKQDFVRHLAKSITGGYAMSEIFTNEKQLYDGVANMDTLFNASMKNILQRSINNSNSSTLALPFRGLYKGQEIDDDPVSLSCQNLVANLFSLNVSGVNGVAQPGDYQSWQRGQKFLEDLSNQSLPDVSDNDFYVMFRDKDVLAVKLTYAPYGSVNGLDNNNSILSAPGYNPVYSRSYKIYIVMDDAELYTVGPNPRPWSN